MTVSPAPPRAFWRRAFPVRTPDWRAATAGVLVSPWVLGALLAVGVVLRLGRYLSDRALWLDESYVALNLMNRSYSDLLGTLDFGQGAPPGFLLAQKLVVGVLGDSEHALRLLPFVSGIVGLFLFYAIARQLLAPVAVPFALLLFAVGEPFVLYSAELKQYGFDVAVGLALLYVFLRTLSRPHFGAREAVVLAVTGATGVWFSHPAAFVLAGVGAGAFATLAWRGDRRGLAALSLPFAAWAVSFLAMYALTLRDFEHVEAATAQSADGAGNPIRNFYMLFYDLGLLKLAGSGIAPVLAIFGAVSLWATPRKRPLLVAGAAMLAATVVAGQLGKYPVGHRFITFLLPFALLCLAEGATRLFTVLPRDLRVAFAAVAALFVVLPPLDTGAHFLVTPPSREEIRPVLAYVGEWWKPGDTLYVKGAAQYALRYYLDCSDCGDHVPASLDAVMRVRPSRGRIQTTPALISESPALVIGRQKKRLYARDVEALRGRDRVWLLITHRVNSNRAQLLEPFARIGIERDCSPVYGGAFACLFDLAPGTTGTLASRAAQLSRAIR